ncbi:serine/threonine-protein kinase [Sorangium sp. So ce145]|uniref:serine/threonine-protein kinase n=1 Tax=Sorangium sp. So ce145 TaxID=3133285 RepID=UPI003F61B042
MDVHKPKLIFDLGHSLGHGGQADVYLLRLRATGSVFAGKFLRETWDPYAREAFIKEAERQVRVAGDHVVRIVTWNFEVEKPFVVMEYMPRGSLAKEVERRGGFTVVEAIDATRRIAVALAELHEHGVLHRDVKPGNVLVDAGGRLLLSDLGLAATMTFTEFVQARGFVGTEGYAAPEQYQGLAFPQSDVFALGRILRELILSRPDGVIAALGQQALLVADRLSTRNWWSRPTAREAVSMLTQLMPRTVTPLVARPIQPRHAPGPPVQAWHPAPAAPAGSGSGGGLAALVFGGFAVAGLAALFSGGSSTWDPAAERYRGRDGRFKKR